MSDLSLDAARQPDGSAGFKRIAELTIPLAMLVDLQENETDPKSHSMTPASLLRTERIKLYAIRGDVDDHVDDLVATGAKQPCNLPLER